MVGKAAGKNKRPEGEQGFRRWCGGDSYAALPCAQRLSRLGTVWERQNLARLSMKWEAESRKPEYGAAGYGFALDI